MSAARKEKNMFKPKRLGAVLAALVLVACLAVSVGFEIKITHSFRQFGCLRSIQQS